MRRQLISQGCRVGRLTPAGLDRLLELPAVGQCKKKIQNCRSPSIGSHDSFHSLDPYTFFATCYCDVSLSHIGQKRGAEGQIRGRMASDVAHHGDGCHNIGWMFFFAFILVVLRVLQGKDFPNLSPQTGFSLIQIHQPFIVCCFTSAFLCDTSLHPPRLDPKRVPYGDARPSATRLTVRCQWKRTPTPIGGHPCISLCQNVGFWKELSELNRWLLHGSERGGWHICGFASSEPLTVCRRGVDGDKQLHSEGNGQAGVGAQRPGGGHFLPEPSTRKQSLLTHHFFPGGIWTSTKKVHGSYVLFPLTIHQEKERTPQKTRHLGCGCKQTQYKNMPSRSWKHADCNLSKL